MSTPYKYILEPRYSPLDILLLLSRHPKRRFDTVTVPATSTGDGLHQYSYTNQYNNKDLRVKCIPEPQKCNVTSPTNRCKSQASCDPVDNEIAMSRQSRQTRITLFHHAGDRRIGLLSSSRFGPDKLLSTDGGKIALKPPIKIVSMTMLMILHRENGSSCGARNTFLGSSCPWSWDD